MQGDADGGSAIVEFVFVAVVIMVPLVYLIASVATVQRTQLAVTQAARDAGRAFATSDTPAAGEERVDAAVRLALHDQGLPDDATVRFVAARHGCDAAGDHATAGGRASSSPCASCAGSSCRACRACSPGGGSAAWAATTCT